jgi:hypothetical protein
MIRSLPELGAGLPAPDLTLSASLVMRAASVFAGAFSITGTCGTLVFGAATTTGMWLSGDAAAGGAFRVGVLTADGAFGVWRISAALCCVESCTVTGAAIAVTVAFGAWEPGCTLRCGAGFCASDNDVLLASGNGPAFATGNVTFGAGANGEATVDKGNEGTLGARPPAKVRTEVGAMGGGGGGAGW